MDSFPHSFCVVCDKPYWDWDLDSYLSDGFYLCFFELSHCSNRKILVLQFFNDFLLREIGGGRGEPSEYYFYKVWIAGLVCIKL